MKKLIIFIYLFIFIACSVKKDSANINVETYENNTRNFLKSLNFAGMPILLIDKPATIDDKDMCDLDQIKTPRLIPKNISKIKSDLVSSIMIKKWSNSYFPNATIIDANDINNILAERFDAKVEPQICYIISRPVFLRDYSYCIIYIEQKWSSIGGGGALYLYKKSSANKWIRIETYCHRIT